MSLTALTIRNVPIVLRSLLGSRGQDVSNLRNPRIVALIDTALETMAYRVARSEDYRALQKEFTGLVPVAGLLSDAVLPAGMIFDIAKASVRETSTKTLLTPVDFLHTLANADLPIDQVFYAPEGTGIRFRDTAGLLTTYVTPVSITANFIPALSEVTPEMQGLFFNTLAGLLTEPRPESRALELSEVGRA